MQNPKEYARLLKAEETKLENPDEAEPYEANPTRAQLQSAEFNDILLQMKGEEAVVNGGRGISKSDPWGHLPLASNALKRFPPPVVQEILNLMAAGKGYKPINAYLKTVGINLTDRRVGQIIAEERAARAPLAKAIVRERLTNGISKDLDVLDTVLDDLMDMANSYKRAKSDHGMYLKFVDRIKMIVDTRLHYSGADAKGDPDMEDAANRVVDKIAKLLDKREAKPDREIEVRLVGDTTDEGSKED